MRTYHYAVVAVLGLFCVAPISQAVLNVGVSSPMQKVMIEGQHKGWSFEPYEGTFATTYDLALARGEKEAFQVVIIPDTNVNNASADVSTLQPISGQGAFVGDVDVWLVGHVKGAAQPRSDLNIEYPSYVVNYNLTDNGGWWPDPLLTFTDSCSINAGDRVAFWVNVATTSATPAGDYTATVTVSATGQTPVALTLNVKVWDFELPARSSLPTAFSIDNLWQASWIYGGSWSSAIQTKYYEMHQDHRLSVVEIYSQPKSSSWFSPWLALNNSFCLSKIPTQSPSGLTSLYNYFNGLGRLDEAFVYGYDEKDSSYYQDMYDKFSEIHTNYPGLRTMTTAYDATFGTSPISYFLRDVVDIWVTGTLTYSPTEAEQLRAEGKDMWWYIAEYPRHPLGANWLLEYPPIEARLLLGAMTYKYNPGGFLYYAATNYGYALWSAGLMSKNGLIESGPYTNWDARSLYSDKYSGFTDADGCLYYPGPASVGPLPSIRSYNIRDGLEDYEYLVLLQDVAGQLGRCPSTPEVNDYVASAQALLEVPTELVEGLTTSSYTRDPAVLYGYRQQLAEAIVDGLALIAVTEIPADTDGDGVGDPCDNCPTVPNADQGNVDGDSAGDACDPDIDGDGIANAQDNCPYASNNDQLDTDDDTVGDVCDNCPDDSNTDQADGDDDSVGDVCDNCPEDSNTDQADGESDDVGDVCDNCPEASNTDQADDDEDGIGDVCDPDPFGGRRVDERFDGMLSGDLKIGSWNLSSMQSRWPLTYSYGGSGGGAFSTNQGVVPGGGAMHTTTSSYRMTANMEPDVSASYGLGNEGIGDGEILFGTDDKPLTVEFTVDFRGEAYGGRSNFYVELSYDDGGGDDQTPRQGMTTEDSDLGNGDQGPWLASRVHSAMAFGSFAGVNRQPNDVESTGTMGSACYFDGLRWHYTKTMTDIYSNYVNLWKSSFGGLTTFKMVIRSETVSLQLTNSLDSPTVRGPYTVSRTYLGGFNRVSMTMGNPLQSSGRYSFVDNLSVRNGFISGVVLEASAGADKEIIRGQSTVLDGTATGGMPPYTAQWSPTEGLDHPDSFQPTASPITSTIYTLTVTDALNEQASDSVLVTVKANPGDLDGDGDVDQNDFGLFQACVSGSGVPQEGLDCQNALLDEDGDVDFNDMIIFDRCYSGPNVPADPECVGQLPPTITLDPVNQSIQEGQSAVFTVESTGSTPLSYQWQKNEIDLSDGGHYSGSNTSTLTVSSADSNDAASYRCDVTNAYGNETSGAATLEVSSDPPEVVCFTNNDVESFTSGVATDWTSCGSSATFGASTDSTSGSYSQGITWTTGGTKASAIYQTVWVEVGVQYMVQAYFRMDNTDRVNGMIRVDYNGGTDPFVYDLGTSAPRAEWGTKSLTFTKTAGSDGWATIFFGGYGNNVLVNNWCRVDLVTPACAGN